MLRPLAFLVVAALPLAANAETLTYTWSPRTQQESDVLRLGLALYALRNELRNGGTVRQRGRGNAARLRQSDSGNWGGIIQRGDDHEADLRQRGTGNAHAIIQGGKGADAEVDQDGGDVGVTIQYGW